MFARASAEANTVAGQTGICICKAGAVRVADSCVAMSVIIPAVILPVFVLFLCSALVYHAV